MQHHIGQHFRALHDTASEPPGEHWQRLGTGGFRLTGGWLESRQYIDGDLFVKDFGLFLWHAGQAHLWAGRGAKGDPGPRGPSGHDGKPGRDGLDGAVIEAAELTGTKLIFVQRLPGGGMAAVEVNLLPFLEACTQALDKHLQDGFTQLDAAVQARIAELVPPPPPPRRRGS